MGFRGDEFIGGGGVSVLDGERDPFGIFVEGVPSWAAFRFCLVTQSYRFFELTKLW